MLFLVSFVFLIQFLTYWLFKPLTTSLTYLLEIRLFPFFLLLIFIFLFSTNKND